MGGARASGGGQASTVDIVSELIDLEGLSVRVDRPRDAESLIDEERFAEDEFLPYWAQLWPSALALARHVARLDLRDRGVLEIGCGVGLPSIVAAIRGARVLATDWAPEALRCTDGNARTNGVQLETRVVPWESPDLLADRSPFELVLAGDVLYEQRNAELVLRLLTDVVGEPGHALVADPGRRFTESFLAEAGSAGFLVATHHAREIPRGGIHELSRPAEEGNRALPPAR